MSILGWRNGDGEDTTAEDHLDGPAADDGANAVRTEDPVWDPRSSAPAELGHVAAELTELRTLFESRLRYDETREEQFSRLYEELESYKKAEASERMLGLARGILLIVDQIEGGSATDAKEIAEDLLDCLATEGIDPIDDAMVGTRSGLEQVVGFTEGGESQTVRRGYRFGDNTLRPRQVLAPRADDAAPQ